MPGIESENKKGELEMKFTNIEVSGIEHIVINRKVKWSLITGSWDNGNGEIHSDADMMDIVSHLKEDRRYRMWIHADTLNIVRKEMTFSCMTEAKKHNCGNEQAYECAAANKCLMGYEKKWR
jgi:hypothetical protein